jgi:iron-sulfur cluster repair protein YtfE (RIC family)
MNTIEITGPLVDYVDSKKPIYELRLQESAEFNELEIDSLIDLIIYEYHFNTRENVAVIYDLAQKLFCRHNGKHPELSNYVEDTFSIF